MNHYIKYLTIVLAISICACSQNDVLHKEAMSYDESLASADITHETATSDNPEITETNNILQRKIIKEGTIRFETSNISQTRELIQKCVNESKGYISNDNVNSYGSTNGNHNVTIRVPAENFDLLLEQITRNDAHRIDSKEIRALDVTEEFIDVEARIKTKKEIENRYKELLKQAHKIEDILAIERVIGSLRTEIESMEGRLRYLKDKVTYSTLTLVFYEKGETVSRYSFGFGGKFINALHDGWINILWFIIGITHLWPFILILIVVIFGIKRIRKNRKNKKTGDDTFNLRP